jgi:hypothetical protein
VTKKEPKSELKKKEPKALVTIETWFSQKMSSGKLQSWQLREMKTFFGAHGLSERETLEDFEQCFKRFEGVQ